MPVIGPPILFESSETKNTELTEIAGETEHLTLTFVEYHSIMQNIQTRQLVPCMFRWLPHPIVRCDDLAGPWLWFGFSERRAETETFGLGKKHRENQFNSCTAEDKTNKLLS